MSTSANKDDPASVNHMNKPGKTGIARLIAATDYSIRGLKSTWQQEEGFRIEVCLAMFFIPLSFLIGQDLSHQLVLVFSCGLVLLAEIINSSIESIVDRVGTEHHPLSGQAKDMGSAAVFLTLIIFLLTWGLSLWHYVA
jgi:diacylglycerol kinase (ATP)